MTREYEEHVEHTFDAYCKRVLRNEAYDHFTALAKKWGREVPIEDYTERLYVVDEYFVTYETFTSYGIPVEIQNRSLSRALKSLSREKLDVVLLTCCIGYPDRIVADMVSIARRTVSYRRSVALEELRRRLLDVWI